MSKEIEALRGIYAAWAEGDFSKGAELWAPDVILIPMGEGIAGHMGLDEVRAHMRDFLSQWEEYRVTAVSFELVGEAILVTEVQHASGRTSGVELDQTFYSVWWFAGGQIRKARWFPRRPAAVAAAAEPADEREGRG